MPYIPVEEYYRETPANVSVAVVEERCKEAPYGRGFFAFGEEDTFTKRQVCITYKHAAPWTGKKPVGKSKVFAAALKKLSQKEPFSLLFYGDSITTGCNSSGLPQGGNTPPHAESFPVMVWKKLQKTFDTEIAYHNTAVGGWNTNNGLENFQEKVLFSKQDMLVLGFGMNDGGSDVGQYAARIEEMLVRFHEENPSSPVVLLATMLPNIHSNWLRNQPLQAAALLALEKKYPFVAVADMTEMHGELLKRKRYRDMTGNNVNHPNDFLARVYAQVILKTVLG
ncbi:MAG: SGNH/GDSL hydrolase family protein [Clostridia bacterium]|nr:SGNH/GDSL hydrolase family protein [Clostridia bacterium]